MRSSRVPRGATGAASASDRHWAAVQRAKRTIADVNRGVWRVIASALLGLAVDIQRVVDYRPRLHCAHACLPWLATAESIPHRPGARMCSADRVRFGSISTKGSESKLVRCDNGTRSAA